MCERLGPARELKVPIIIIKMIIKKVAQETQVIIKTVAQDIIVI